MGREEREGGGRTEWSTQTGIPDGSDDVTAGAGARESSRATPETGRNHSENKTCTPNECKEGLVTKYVNCSWGRVYFSVLKFEDLLYHSERCIFQCLSYLHKYILCKLEKVSDSI